MDYKGNVCKVCGEKFTESDDIVVCPECGTPYHRECYKKEGRCINTELHQKHESWKPEISEKNDYEEPYKCEKCGYENNPSSRFCEGCGASLYDEKKILDDMNDSLQKAVCESMNIDDEEIDGVKMYKLAYFVRNNIPYYITMFKRFNKTGKKISFNFLCFLFPYYYFACRKMYGWAAASFAVITLLSVPAMMDILTGSNGLMTTIDSAITQTSMFSAVLNVTNFLTIAFKIIIAMLANWIYCKFAVKSVKSLEGSCSDTEMVYVLMKKGGTNIWAIVITFAIELVVMTGLMMILGLILFTSSV